jgi:hypothetical protein
MKNLLLILVFLLFTNSALFSQSDTTSQGEIVSDLTTITSSSGGSPEVWPWNGCREFEVTLKLKVMEIQTHVTICCSMGICQPVNQQRNQIEPNSKVEVVQSSVVQVENYRISIARGIYSTNSEGNLKNLKYLIKTNR